MAEYTGVIERLLGQVVNARYAGYAGQRYSIELTYGDGRRVMVIIEECPTHQCDDNWLSVNEIHEYESKDLCPFCEDKNTWREDCQRCHGRGYLPDEAKQ